MNMIRRKLSAILLLVFLATCCVNGLAETAAPDSVPEAAGGEPAIHVIDDVWRAGDFLYRVLADGTAELVAFEGESPDWEIPREIGGVQVTAIGERCFSNQGDMNYYTDEYPDYHREYIRRVTIPEGIHTVGAWAFENCFNLIEVVFPESLRRIGAGAFSGCGLLMKLALPEGLQELGDYAFQGCHSLIEMRLPGSLQRLGSNPFADCSHLARLVPDPAISFLRYERGLLIDTEQQKLIGCTKEAWDDWLNVPEGIRVIGESALARTPFEEIRLPSSLETIESYAFSCCTELRKLAIPAGVDHIGGNPFRGCQRLENLTLAEGQKRFSLREDALFDDQEGRLIAYLRLIAPAPETDGTGTGFMADEEKKVEYPEWQMFGGVWMHLLRGEDRDYHSWFDLDEIALGEDYTVPEGTRSIGGYAFYRADVGMVMLPDSVTALGNGAFADCVRLMVCLIPDGVQAIPDSLFQGSYCLLDAALPEGICSIGAHAFSDTALEQIILPSTVRSLGPYAFSDCPVLQEIVLNDGLDRIPKGAFCRSMMIGEIVLPESVKVIEPQAFAFCQSLKSVNLPSGLQMIPDFCFYDTHLQQAVVPEGVTYIGDHAFRTGEYTGSCLETVQLPEGLEYLGNCAFYGGIFQEVSLPGSLKAVGKEVFRAAEVKTVTLAEGLRRIGEGMFRYCRYLEDLALPDTVTWIDDMAFGDCYGLKSVRLPKGPVTISGNPFAECPALKTVSLQENHPNLRLEGNLLLDLGAQRVVAWLPLAEEPRCAVPEGIRTIGANAFEEVQQIKEVVLPGSLRVVEEEAFAGSSLAAVHLPEGLEEIGDAAFSDTELLEIVLPDSLRKIGSCALASSKISQVTVPASVTEIGADAFADIRDVTLPDTFRCYTLTLDDYGGTISVYYPKEDQRVTFADGNLFDQEEQMLLGLSDTRQVRSGIRVMKNGTFTNSEKPLIIPESVELIEAFGADWNYIRIPYVYAVPGSVAEACFEHGYFD